MRRRFIAALGTAVAVVVSAAMGTVPVSASADAKPPAVVSANPVDYTPHITDGTVWSVAVLGETVVVGGTFTKVTDHTRRVAFNRHNIFAYGLRDGVIRAFAPTVDGPVYSLAAGAGNTVHLGGGFRTVNGVAQRGLARLSLATGARVPGFQAKINWGDVRSVAVSGTRLYAGGTFTAVNGVPRTALARLNATTGAVDLGFNAQLSAPGLSRTRVEHFDLSRDGRRLVAVGAIVKAGGKDRKQVVLLDVSGAAVVSNWYTNAYQPACRAGFETYVRQVKFSPAGDYFVAVTTGREANPAKLCDTAARFETAGAGLHNATWINWTGGDSLYAVAVTEGAVYVGGHQRWMSNPFGKEAAGPGAIARPGIAALDVRTGKPLPWNPTKDRGVGIRAFAVTSVGLLVGSDTTQLGREYHGRIGMFPY